MAGRKIVVQIEYNSDVDSLLKKIDDLMKDSRNPDLVYVKLSSAQFPNKVLDLPRKLVNYCGIHPNVKFIWDGISPIANDEVYNVVEYDCPQKLCTRKKSIQDTLRTEIPCITVCILTHNRTNVACATIDYLVKNLKYGNLKWCISDDRSTEKNHIGILVQQFLKNNINDVKVLKTNDKHFGLGASMNNALKYAWTNGELALTIEDDWILQKELDLSYYAKILIEDKNTSLIRLSFLDGRHNVTTYDDKMNIVGKSSNNFIFNNQCGLRHKRIYDLIGYNIENCHGDEQEQSIRDRYNKMTNFGEKYKVLWPNHLKIDSMDDPSLYFVHVGKSVSGHGWYGIPKRFKWIYEEKWNNEIKTMIDDKLFFRIIIPTFNTSSTIRRCMDSIRKQTFNLFKVVVVDDNSDDQKKTREICQEYDFVEYVQLNNHVDAGGCRNIGMQYFQHAKYTMFCDSDDYYMDNDAFLKLYNYIIECNYPECVSFSFYWEQFKKISEPDKLEAPWCRCIDTKLCKQFKAHRRKQNDVIWYFRQFDGLKRVSQLKDCLYYYTCDNPLSCSSNLKSYKNNNRVLASYFYLLADFLEEKFTDPKTRKDAAKTFDIVYKRIMNNYDLKTLIKIIEDGDQSSNK